MDLKGRKASYGPLAAGLHWLSAMAIMAMIPLGFAAAHASGSAQAAALLRWHLPLGLVVLGLTLARVVWQLWDVRPEMPAGMPRWQGRLARVNHALLYIALFSLSGSGIATVVQSHAAAAILSVSGGRLPDFSALPPFAVHAASVLGLLGLLVLHLCAAAYHQLYRRDHLLARMSLGRRRAS